MVPSKWRHVSDEGTPGAAVLCCSDVVLTVFLLEAKDVVRKLLVVDPSKRMSINEALQHPWLQVRNPGATSLTMAATSRSSMISLHLGPNHVGDSSQTHGLPECCCCCHGNLG